MAFATADMELLERVVHWPSAYEHLVADRPEAAIGVEAMKGIMLKKLGETLEAVHFLGMALIALGLSAIDGRLWQRCKTIESPGVAQGPDRNRS